MKVRNFPHCCAASVIEGFAYDTGSRTKSQVREDLLDFFKTQLTYISPIITAATNSHQKYAGAVLKELGFGSSEWIMGNEGNNVKVWFVNSRKLRKKVNSLLKSMKKNN